MPRKTSIVEIRSTDRDQGKQFFLEEMAASRAEKWGWRVGMACRRAGAEITDEVLAGGMATIAAWGLMSLTKMHWADAEPLLDEMFECVRIVPDPRHPEVIRPLIEDDIEEVVTRLLLRDEVLKLHTDFSFAAVLSRATASQTPKGDTDSSTTPTSPAASQR